MLGRVRERLQCFLEGDRLKLHAPPSPGAVDAEAWLRQFFVLAPPSAEAAHALASPGMDSDALLQDMEELPSPRSGRSSSPISPRGCPQNTAARAAVQRSSSKRRAQQHHLGSARSGAMSASSPSLRARQSDGEDDSTWQSQLRKQEKPPGEQRRQHRNSPPQQASKPTNKGQQSVAADWSPARTTSHWSSARQHGRSAQQQVMAPPQVTGPPVVVMAPPAVPLHGRHMAVLRPPATATEAGARASGQIRRDIVSL